MDDDDGIVLNLSSGGGSGGSSQKVIIQSIFLDIIILNSFLCHFIFIVCLSQHGLFSMGCYDAYSVISAFRKLIEKYGWLYCGE